MTQQRPIILIDGMNVFLRHFCANPTVSASGELIGGIVGFLKFIEWIINNMSPQKIYVVWEKGGGSARRKAIYPRYKQNRARIDDLKEVNKIPDPDKAPRIMDNHESKLRQLLLLTEILKCLPVCQVYHEDCECDDVLAYLVKEKFQDSSVQKIVISSDKDFYQLLTRDDIIIYDQGKKSYITAENVMERFGIPPLNFLLAKTIDGDSSDNIEGIKGLGLKTILKCVPEIANSNKEMGISDLIECVREKLAEKPKTKAYQSILEGEDIIRRNWQLMYLGLSTMSSGQRQKVDAVLEKFQPKYDKLKFLISLQKNDIVLAMDFDLFERRMKNCLLTSS